MTPQQVSDIATFLHKRIIEAAFRQTYTILDVLTGNAQAGEVFFNGAGGCGGCHSATGDLKGIGSRFEVEALQTRMIMPPRRTGNGPGSENSKRLPTATVTVAPGKTFSGVLIE